MSLGKYRTLTYAGLLSLLTTTILLAGTTGKITGKVVDKSSGETLPSVNVMVKGTLLGGTTDVNGYYVILLVPPGVHTVTASVVGYANVTVNDIRVNIDETSPVDIAMQQKTIEMVDMVIVAERNVVRKDVSTSVSAVANEEISTLPVTSIDDIIGLQAGVEEGLVIRGGESDQLLFQIDGVTFRDPRDNKPIAMVPLSSIQEVSIERGGFNAEYGQVRSGVINIVSKEGKTDHYTGSIQVKYSPPAPKYFGISVFDPNSMWNKPFLDPEVCWTGTKGEPFTDLNNDTYWEPGESYTDVNKDGRWTGWDKYTQRQYPQFDGGWNAVSQALLSDDDPTNDLTPAAAQQLWKWQHRRRPTIAPDYNVDGGFGGPVPFISSELGNLRFFTSFRLNREMLLIPLSRDDYKDYDWSLKINSDISQGFNLMLSSTIGKSYNVAMNADDRQFNNPAWGINGVQFWNPTDYVHTPYQIAEITNEQRASRIFTDSWYSEADVSHFTLAGKLTAVVTASTYYDVSVEHVNRNYFTGPIGARDLTKQYEIVPGYFVDEAPFGFSSNPETGIGDPRMFFGGHSATIRDSSKLNSYLLKANISSQLNEQHLVKAGIEFSFYDISLDYGLVNVAFGGTNYVKEKWRPYRVSAYAQDKIEALGFIANIGLRVDISNPNTEWADVDPFDKEYFSADYLANPDYPRKKAAVDVSVSPRLGISHPITENSKLFFNYGHFKQMPAYEEIFRLGRGSSGGMLNYGDPNLIQSKTIAYELGYDHVLFESYLLQLAAFYNDITDQQAFTQYVSDRKSIGYFKANNNSYEDVRGLEVTMKKAEGDWVRGFATFTYQVSTQGAFGRQAINEEPSQQKFIDQNTIVLYQQKPVPQPRSRVSLTFLTPESYGPEFSGLRPLGFWSINFLGEWRSGAYYTYNPLNLPDVVNNVQIKDFFNVDLRVNKSFDFKYFNLTAFIDVRNLLNLKRLSGASFYDPFDQLYYLQSLHLPESAVYDNIPGDDRIGEVRKGGVKYQPVEQIGDISRMDPKTGDDAAIYYDKVTKKYYNVATDNGSKKWSEVEQGRMQKVLDDKSYIDMPNNSSFNYLNPRQVFFGINLSFKF